MLKFDNQMYSEIDSVFNELSVQVDNRKKEIDECYSKLDELAPKKLFDQSAKKNYEDIIKEIGTKYNLERDKIRKTFDEFLVTYNEQRRQFKKKYQSFLDSMAKVSSKEDMKKVLDTKMIQYMNNFKYRLDFEANRCVSKKYLYHLLDRADINFRSGKRYYFLIQHYPQYYQCGNIDYSQCFNTFDEKLKDMQNLIEAETAKLFDPQTFVQGSTYFDIEGKSSANYLWPKSVFKTFHTSIRIRKDKINLNVEVQENTKGVYD